MGSHWSFLIRELTLGHFQKENSDLSVAERWEERKWVRPASEGVLHKSNEMEGMCTKAAAIGIMKKGVILSECNW